MFDINSLGLNPEEFNDVNFDSMPATIGGSFAKPPQPATYIFKMPPAQALFAAINPVATTEWGQRVALKLKDAAALKNTTLGEQYNGYISNVPRYIGSGDNRQAVSDWLMLLKALGITPEGNNNAAHVKAMLLAADRLFSAEHTLTANCSETRDIYKDGSVQKGVKGCGLRYAVKGYSGRNGKPDTLSIPKDEEGLVATRFLCACGAEVSCFGKLQAFRGVE